jgi:hypothetical protein
VSRTPNLHLRLPSFTVQDWHLTAPFLDYRKVAEILSSFYTDTGPSSHCHLEQNFSRLHLILSLLQQGQKTVCLKLLPTWLIILMGQKGGESKKKEVIFQNFPLTVSVGKGNYNKEHVSMLLLISST